MKKIEKLSEKIGDLIMFLLYGGLILFMGIFLYSCCGGTFYAQTEDIAYYQALSGETEGKNALTLMGKQQIPVTYDLPMLDELEPCAERRFLHTAKVNLFRTDTYTLICRYDEQEYLEKKQWAESAYLAWREPLGGSMNEEILPEFEMDGFSFRVVEGGFLTREMLFLGTSDEKREIAWIYFYDFDLDAVNPRLDEFLKEETGRNKVV